MFGWLKKIFEFKYDEEILFDFLQEAADKLKKKGSLSGMFSHYNSAEELGKFIESKIPGLRDRTISAEDLHELECIFIPTSEWDEYDGGPVLGDLILKDLREYKERRKIPSKV